MSKYGPDPARRFRASVYRSRAVSLGCKVMLLRMADEMRANGFVSIPRDRLAGYVGVAPTRITEWVRQAIDQGFLSVVVPGRPGTTAVYQLLIVGTESVPTWEPSR